MAIRSNRDTALGDLRPCRGGTYNWRDPLWRTRGGDAAYDRTEFFTNFTLRPLHVVLPAILRAMSVRFSGGAQRPFLLLSDSFRDAVGMTFGAAYAQALWARAFYADEAPDLNGAFRIMLRDLRQYDDPQLQPGIPRTFRFFQPSSFDHAGYGMHPLLPFSAISLRIVLAEPENPPINGGWKITIECPPDRNCALYLLARTQLGEIRVVSEPPYVVESMGGGEFIDVIVANVDVNNAARELPSAGLGVRIGVDYGG